MNATELITLIEKALTQCNEALADPRASDEYRLGYALGYAKAFAALLDCELHKNDQKSA